MQDLDIAKRRFSEEKFTLVIVKNTKVIFETRLHGISGFLRAIEKLENRLTDASVADKVAGKAVALLCAHAKIKALYAETLSRNAKEFLEENLIHHEYDKLVENILGLDKAEICPFEKAAMEISDPEDAYARFKTLPTSSTQEVEKDG